MSKGFLTVKEFAEQANISQQAVYKQLNSRLKPFIHNVKGQKFIEATALEKFYSTQVVQSLNPDSTQENQDIQPQVVQPLNPDSILIQPQKDEQTDTEKQQELEDQIKELQKQIKQIIENDQEERQFLRDQIKQKDKQIESLTENLKIAQHLAAADKKKVMELEAKQQENMKAEVEVQVDPAASEDNIDRQQKKGLFARLFNL